MEYVILAVIVAAVTFVIVKHFQKESNKGKPTPKPEPIPGPDQWMPLIEELNDATFSGLAELKSWVDSHEEEILHYSKSETFKTVYHGVMDRIKRSFE